MGWTVRRSNPSGGGEIFRTGAHPASYTMGTGSVLGVKRPRRDADPQSSMPRLKEEYSYTSTHPKGLSRLYRETSTLLVISRLSATFPSTLPHSPILCAIPRLLKPLYVVWPQHTDGCNTVSVHPTPILKAVCLQNLLLRRLRLNILKNASRFKKATLQGEKSCVCGCSVVCRLAMVVATVRRYPTPYGKTARNKQLYIYIYP